jgi:hypothetical protein
VDGDGHVAGVSELIDALLTRRVIRASFHENGHLNEILFLPPEPKDGAKKAEKDPRKDKRDYYEVLYNRHVGDQELDALPD